MPIDTGTAAWESEVGLPPDENDLLGVEVTFFLREHSGKAFTALEVADEVLDTDWEAVLEGSATDEQVRAYQVATAQVQAALATLCADGTLDVRLLDPADAADRHLATDNAVAHFSYDDSEPVSLGNA